MDNRKKGPETSRDEIMAEARMKIIKIASVGIAGAIVLICYAYTKVEDAFLQTALFGLASLVAVISGIIILSVLSIGKDQKAKHNFFLYDRRLRREIAVGDLTVTLIRERLREFMNIFKRRGKLYVGELFDDNPNIPEPFKTLFCYEILYSLASGDGGIDAKTFLGFGGECADIFSKYLRENGDYELATGIRGFVFNYSLENNNSESFTEYLKTQKEHIEKSMLSYTLENIDKFK